MKLDENKTTLIVGENGAGKSSMLDAISFALYGKPFRKINKPQLLNSINKKQLEVKLSLTVNGKSYLIRRGMKPNVFEIWREGELVNQDAAARDYQAYLEENILNLNHKSFGQVVVLGSSTFVPFMQLPAAARRSVIEDLLDIQIFTTMNSLLKDKIQANKDEVKDIKYQIDLSLNRLEDMKNHNASILKIKKGEVSRIKEKMRERLTLIDDAQKKIKQLELNIDLNTASINDKSELKLSLTDHNKDLATYSAKLAQVDKDIKFYENHDDCPTCKQGIAHDFKEDVVKKNATMQAILQTNVDASKNAIEQIETRLREIAETEKTINTNKLEVGKCNANIQMATNALHELKREMDEISKEREIVETKNTSKIEKELRDYHKQQEDLFDDREVLGVVGAMLKDGGIKTRIIKQYVPVMNKLINKYLAAMDFFVQFELDENFNETIKSRFRDEFSYGSFSEGEKLRINLAILFAWRAVSKLRNSVATNLLIMDEIMDSSLDNDGTEEFLKIINDLTSDSNIFIISHKGDQMHDKFDQVIKFEKVKNYSRMVT